MADSEDNAKRGIVYILRNESMPGYIKIGRCSGDSARHVEKRMSELHTTGVPLPFECIYAAVVADAPGVERKLHVTFERDRVPGREFFVNLPVKSAEAALKIAAGTEITPETPTQDAEGKPVEVAIKPKRSALRFSTVNIPQGAKLTFLHDENITCTVEGDRQVNYQGKITALSPLAQELLGWSTMPSGFSYWVYEGETLNERRWRLESEEEE